LLLTRKRQVILPFYVVHDIHNHSQALAYAKYIDDPSVLSLPDQFSCEMSTIPGYRERLRAMIFQMHFHEKILEVIPVSVTHLCTLDYFFWCSTKDFEAIKEAAIQLEQSKSMKKLLEVNFTMPLDHLCCAFYIANIGIW